MCCALNERGEKGVYGFLPIIFLFWTADVPCDVIIFSRIPTHVTRAFLPRVNLALFTCCNSGPGLRVAPLYIYNCDYLVADVLRLSAKRLFSSYFTICFVRGLRTIYISENNFLHWKTDITTLDSGSRV